MTHFAEEFDDVIFAIVVFFVENDAVSAGGVGVANMLTEAVSVVNMMLVVVERVRRYR